MKKNNNKNNLSEIVLTNQNYYYALMKNNIDELKKTYPFLKIGNIGYSVLGKEIPYIKIGNGKKEILYHASIHANEWITSVILMKFIENFCKAYILNKTIKEYQAQKLFNQVSLYIIPMVNPDGVDLVTKKLEKNSDTYKNYEKISKEFPNIPFPYGWKANFNGVDLNLQFPAGWEFAKKIKFKQGYIKPAPRDFIGKNPLTEPEALAIYNFTLKHNFSLTISYHTQGKEIYWNFQNKKPQKGYQIGKKLAKTSGYNLKNVPYNSSFAGYKDWFIKKYNRPSYTVEAGLGKNPISITQFNQIYKENEGILIYGMTLA